MNINLIRLKPVISELRGIRTELARIAECLEVDLADRGVHVRPPKADTSGPEPTVSFVDEEMDWAHENIERLKRQDQLARDEEGT